MLNQAEAKRHGTPAYYLTTLSDQLDKQVRAVKTYEDWREGRHPLAFATSKWREKFGRLFEGFSDNWCDLVVEVALERMEILGFRFTPDEGADDDAQAIWQANHMDAESLMAMTEAVTCGKSYLLVAPDPNDSSTPLITVESARQVIVLHAPGNRRIRLAALKRWIDPRGYVMATLILPHELHKWQSKDRIKDTHTGRINWIRRQGAEEAEENPLGIVNMIPLYNKPHLLDLGHSDLEPAIPINRAIDKLAADMLVGAEFSAFRQRWATGIEIPTDPETNKPMSEDQFLSAVDRLWGVPNDKAKFGEFGQTELGNYVKAIEMFIQHLAAQTRTPPHYLLGQSGAFPSGESLKATETGLVARVKRKQVFFGEAFEEAMRLAFLIKGDERRATALDAETIWRDPESRSFGELVDGLVKLRELNVPDEILWERAGFSPQEINRMKTMREADALLASALGDSEDDVVDGDVVGLPPGLPS